MSKRGAEEYITKENGSTPNSSSEGDKVKMATAAQLAKRKIAQPKSRAGRTGTSPMPSTAPSNPFAGTTAFGQPQNNQQSTFQNAGGFTFGSSQSFPPGDTSSNGGINFSVPGQSSSFTFGQPVQNNPFANMNGSSNHNSPPRQQPGDITMESPQKKPAFGSGLFGSNNNANTAQSAGFSFGQTSNQPASQSTFSFGQSQGFGSASGTPLFGQSASKPSETSSSNMYGQPLGSPPKPASDTNNVFGQSPSVSQHQTPSSGFSFGQSTATSSSSLPAFSFIQPAASTTSSPSTTPAFSFGQSSVQPSSSDKPFGAPSPSSTSGFGVSATAPQPIPPGPLFGSESATSANNVLGGFGTTKVADPAVAGRNIDTPEQENKPLFGQSLGSTVQDSLKTNAVDNNKGTDGPAVNPFAGLFGQSTTQQPTFSTAADTPKSLFSFAAPSQPSGIFSLSKENNDISAKTPQNVAQKSPFSFGAPAANSAATSFSPSKSTTEPQPSTNPFATLSAAKTQSVVEQKSDKPQFGFAKETPRKDDTPFQPLPSFGTSSTKSLPPGDSTSKSFGGLGSTKSSPPTFAKPPKSSFENSQKQGATSAPSALNKSAAHNMQETTMSKPDLFTETARAAASTTSTPGESDSRPESTTETVKRSVNTHPPSRVPPYLNGDDYKSYDSNYRLHSLNREFQKRIASLDPSREDFENIIRNYVAARESIGESIGLYTRNLAGMKRKSDEETQYDDASSSAKRTKPSEVNASQSLLSTDQKSASVFQPVPSSYKPSLLFTNSSSASVPASSPAKSATSSLFSSMIPEKGTSTGPAASNPFANLAKGSTPMQPPQNAAKPAFSFGTSNSAPATVGSTTPTKSPPKKPAFEMPKFTSSGTTNFADAFKKQSEERAAKEKAKRKAEDFDSEDDDEEEWEKKYEEEQRAKKAKVDEVVQTGFKPTFGNGTGTSSTLKSVFGNASSSRTTAPKSGSAFGLGNHAVQKSTEKAVEHSENDNSGDDEDEGSGESGTGSHDGNEEEDEAEEDDLPEDDVEAEEEDEDNDDDLETVLSKSGAKGRSLFDRVTPNPNSKKQQNPEHDIVDSVEKTSPKKPTAFGNSFGKPNAEASAFSSLTSAGSKDPYVPSKTFNFTPTPPVTSPKPVVGASIFAGGTMRDGPVAGEGLFGSRPSTPSNAEKPKSSVFGNIGAPSTSFGTDNTWKKGSEIKFGSSAPEAPSVSITAPSPRKDESKPFANLFGATTSSANSASSAPTLGFEFGQSSVPGFLAAASHLTGTSGTNSGFSSRATSPGTTDNESVATNEEEHPQDTQVSLMESHPGEENETCLFEVRAKASRFYNEEQIKGTKLTKGWNTVGVGNVRLLKHKETGKARLVMRAEPSANVVLNTNLYPAAAYEFMPHGSSGIIKLQCFTEAGPQAWMLKTKLQQPSKDLTKLLEENKKASN